MDLSAQDICRTSPVSWQTAFWTLVPLAIAAVSQRSGKFCGLSSRYRVYLRSSPILCAADLLSIIARFLTTIIYLSASPQESLGLLLHERFNDIDADAGNEGMEGVEQIFWFRWLLFILGILPSAIKMAGFQGVPLTRLWGFLFLTSYLMMEFLVSWASANENSFRTHRSGRIEWLGYDAFRLQRGIAGLTRLLKAINLMVVAIAFILHWDILLWAYCDIWIPMPAYSFSLKGIYDFYRFSTLYLPIFVALCIFRPAGLFLRAAPALPRPIMLRAIIFIALVTCGVVSVAVLVSNFVDRGPFDEIGRKIIALSELGVFSEEYVWANDFLGYILVLSILLLLCLFLGWGFSGLALLSMEYRALGRQLLLVFDEQFDLYACCALLFFIVNWLITVLWYCFKYNPEGTLNPGWTGDLG